MFTREPDNFPMPSVGRHINLGATAMQEEEIYDAGGYNLSDECFENTKECGTKEKTNPSLGNGNT